MKAQFIAVSDGTDWRVEDRDTWASVLRDQAGKRVIITIQPWRASRSGAQNRWYWGVIVPAVRDVLSLTRDVPLSKDQVHEVLRSAFLGLEDTPLGSVARNTRGLTTAEFSDYCEAIRAHAAADWGLHIPGPGKQLESSSDVSDGAV